MHLLSAQDRGEIERMDVPAVMWEVGDGSTLTPEQRRNGARWLAMWVMYSPEAWATREAFLASFGGQGLDGGNLIDLIIEMCEMNVANGKLQPPG